MRQKNNLTKRILSLLLVISLVAAYVPLSAAAAANDAAHFRRVADANTMDGWKNYFSLTDLNTANAGGVWTDKSVFTDASAFGGMITMTDSQRNFLTALSAIAANKEVVGYSTVPTDTVLVLDLSNSMDGYETQLIAAANEAIRTLLGNNENNRVGVVLYSGHNSNSTSSYEDGVTRLLDIDRYTAASNGSFLTYSRGNVSVTSGVTAQNGSSLNASKAFEGATYIQAGLWEAMEMFMEMDTEIAGNNWQAGENRMPILVLMSDGAPTTGTSYYDDVKNSQYTSGRNTTYKSNVGDGRSANLLAGNVFLTQLTASYVMSQIDAHYKQTDPYARSLFYTLGFNVRGNTHAEAVLDPDNSTMTDNLWRSYLAMDSNDNLSVRVKGRSSSATDVSIQRNSYVTSKSYVNGYFSASTNQNGLQNAFASIVDEILIQSRYYPTHLEGGNPDFAGYVSFTDRLGEYMEVKDIKGFILGNTLFNGRMFSANIGIEGLGTVEAPTELGTEFIRSVRTRLGISAEEAQALIASAYAAGQLAYDASTGKYSNYVGWYASANGNYLGFWNEGVTVAPADAVYTVKSYGFLGETTGSIKNSDMMYMTVRVQTSIATGSQTLSWKIPAALVPLITYNVTLEGTNVEQARNVSVDVDAATPIRLIFETGLRSDLNELNITRITEKAHVAADGVTRQFWNNWFDISSSQHEDHKTTVAEFTPSKENERFYYTFDSAVFTKQGENYALTNGASPLDPNGEYYRRRYIFTEDSTVPVFYFEKLSAASVAAAKRDTAFETKDNQVVDTWYVPMGTPARELQMYSALKADEEATRSAHMIFYPYLSEQNGTMYVEMNLGNNGLLEVTPAQGIKLSKTVDIYENGTSDSFRFRITVKNANGTNYTGAATMHLTALDVVPLTAGTTVNFSAGVYEANLSRDETLWLTGIPAGATYTVEEISDNDDYKIKSVHVNGVSWNKVAQGTVAAYYIDDVRFVNTAIGEGDLVITKQVQDKNGIPVNISSNVKFTMQVALTDQDGSPVSGTFDATSGRLTVPAGGVFTVTLSAGESFVLRGIPEETRYTVTETNIPNGFRLNAEKSKLTGVVDAAANDQALVVNTYVPTAVTGESIGVEIFKELSGNRTQWLDGEAYFFQIQRQDTGMLTRLAISSASNPKRVFYTLRGETYETAGTYNYRIIEEPGTQGGVTYDTAERRFTVTVADSDMDGDLEIVSVNNFALTTVSGTTVTARFNNVYTPGGSDTVTVEVLKKMTGSHGLAGFQFALYGDEALTEEILRSTVTNAAGEAKFTLTYAANRVGQTYTYYMAEIVGSNPNITYSDAVYKLEVTVSDNLDGTISASTAISPVRSGAMEAGIPTFTNIFTPSASDFLRFVGTKRIEGDRILNAREFRFVLEAVTAGAPMPAVTTVTNNADGSFAFDEIEFADAGVYEYRITEDAANPIGGFTYDNSVYTVTVTVVDNGDATLTATAVTKKNGIAQEIVFVNTYDATDAKTQLQGEKLLTGKTLEEGEFSFKLEALTPNAPMPAAAIVTNNAAGRFAFGEMTFAKAGTYIYRLTEVAGTDSRYSYDPAVYTVTVTVTDNSRGVLTAAVTMEKDGVAATAAVFRNNFKPEAIEYGIETEYELRKALSGRELLEGEFAFELINAITGQRIGETVTNAANGAIRFPAIQLPETGIYHFKIVELFGDQAGITYDNSSFHIRLQVELQGKDLVITDSQLHKGTVTKQEVDGVLTEVTTYEEITASGEAVFRNRYTVADGEVIIAGIKKLQGRQLLPGEFTFELYVGETLWDTATNLTDGTFAFKTIPVSGSDTVVFTVKEVKGDTAGITYDERVYTVTVTAADETKDGQWEITYEYEVEGEAVDGIEFVNIFEAPQPEPPKTADGSLLGLMIPMLLLSATAMLAVLLVGKRKEQ